jgi:DNA-binding Lrp family transcriptional regulator
MSSDNEEIQKEFLPIKLRKIADGFYEKFKNTPIGVKKNPFVYEKFNSVVIFFKDGSGFLIPDFFYQQSIVDPTIDYSEILSKELSWIDIVSNIFDYTSRIKTSLQISDIKILRALTFYKRSGLFNNIDYSNRRNILIQIKTLARITNLSEKWASERINYLIKSYVLHFYFILNPFLFGLNTYLLLYERKYEHESSYLDQVTLFNLKLNYSEMIRIIQLPNIQASDDLEFNFPTKTKKISEMHLFNNLSGLTNDKSSSFKKIPNFEKVKSPIVKPTIDFKQNSTKWSNDLEFNDKEENFYPILKKLSYAKRISIILRILNYLAKWGMINGNLTKTAKELRMTPVELAETCRFIFDNDMLAFFPRISRIGTSNRYGIYIEDVEGRNGALLTNAYYNLLELPQSCVFLGNNFIFAYITMPDNFITPFFRYITSLQEKLIVKYGMFIALKSWGRFSLPLPEGTTVDEFGVNFPLNVLENLKSQTS